MASRHNERARTHRVVSARTLARALASSALVCGATLAVLASSVQEVLGSITQRLSLHRRQRDANHGADQRPSPIP